LRDAVDLKLDAKTGPRLEFRRRHNLIYIFLSIPPSLPRAAAQELPNFLIWRIRAPYTWKGFLVLFHSLQSLGRLRQCAIHRYIGCLAKVLSVSEQRSAFSDRSDKAEGFLMFRFALLHTYHWADFGNWRCAGICFRYIKQRATSFDGSSKSDILGRFLLFYFISTSHWAHLW